MDKIEKFINNAKRNGLRMSCVSGITPVATKSKKIKNNVGEGEGQRNTYTAVVATDQCNRNRIRINLEGMTVPNGGVPLLYEHGYDSVMGTLPIGLMQSTKIENGDMIASLYFNSRGSEIEQMFNAGELKNFSVTIFPKEAEVVDMTEAEVERVGGEPNPWFDLKEDQCLAISASDLGELSVVITPAEPDATKIEDSAELQELKVDNSETLNVLTELVKQQAETQKQIAEAIKSLDVTARQKAVQSVDVYGSEDEFVSNKDGWDAVIN